MIIGICGEIGAGKTTLAKCIVNNNMYKVLSFAGRFKSAMCVLYNWDPDQMHSYEYKAGIDPITGKTRRELMQSFATEYIRDKIDPIYHTKITAIDTLAVLDQSLVVFDDVRHHDEVEFIRAIGGVLILVKRPNNPFEQAIHRSEGNKLEHDYLIVNSGKPIDMYHELVDHTDYMPSGFSQRKECLSNTRLLVKKYIEGWYYD